MARLSTTAVENGAHQHGVKYWEIIADNLSAAGWSWGYVSHVNLSGQTLFSVDAHRDDERRYIVHSDELLTAFLELEQQARASRGKTWTKNF